MIRRSVLPVRKRKNLRLSFFVPRHFDQPNAQPVFLPLVRPRTEYAHAPFFAGGGRSKLPSNGRRNWDYESYYRTASPFRLPCSPIDTDSGEATRERRPKIRGKKEKKKKEQAFSPRQPPGRNPQNERET